MGVIRPGDGDPRHGSINGYGNHGCRCPRCTEAHRINHHRYMNADPRRLARHALAERLRNKAKRETRTGTPARETN